MAKAFKTEEPWFGSFTPFDPNAPAVVLPAEEPLPMPEAIPAVPNVYPAGRTYESFLYEEIQALDTGSGGFTATVTSPANGDTLIYNSGTGVFENKAPAATPFLPLAGGTIAGTLTVACPALAAPLVTTASFTVTTPAHTAVGTGVTVTDVAISSGGTLQLATGARAQITCVTVAGRTYSAVAASTIDEGVGVFLNSLPVAGTNVTLTQRYALYVNGPTKFVGGTTGGTDVVWVLPTDNTPVGASVGRIPIQIGGAIKYIPYHSA